MIMRTLFKGTDRELRITEKNGNIIVETLQELERKRKRKEMYKFLKEVSLVVLLLLIFMAWITYLITTL